MTIRWDTEDLPQIIKDAVKTYMENQSSYNAKRIEQLEKELESL